jgi:hypothetical protein
LNELVELAYNQTRNQEIQLNSSFSNRDAAFDKIPRAQPSILQNEYSEEKAVSEVTSLIEDQEEPNSTCDDLLGHSTTHTDKYALNDTVETSQNSGTVNPFYPQESRDEQTIDEECPFESNSRFIEDKMAGRLR